jgi:DNA-binding response OmpR family regulator
MIKKFLIAEDDEEDLMIFKDAIQAADVAVEVTSVISCDELLSIINLQTIPDLVIIDTSLPGRSTLECITAIRATYKAEQLPVIVLSTAISPTLQVKGYIAGFNLMLKKPDSFIGTQDMVRKLYNMDWIGNPFLTPEEFKRLEI